MEKEMQQEISAKNSDKKPVFMLVFMGVVILAMTTGVGFILWKLLGMLK